MLVLSLFPGIDLLGRGFEAEGYCVVRGPDIIWGGDIREFHPTPRRFDGVIGGSPCQDFSRARRSAPTGYGLEMLSEFARVVTAAAPEWWLLENVDRVPDVKIDGYTTQRLDLNARECGLKQSRHRHIQFGSRKGWVLVPERLPAPAEIEPVALATEGRRTNRRGWPEFCEAQGLPRNFVLDELTLSSRYKAVGNGVPVPMARVLARAVRAASKRTKPVPVCACGCGRIVTGQKTYAIAACRQRAKRRRDAAPQSRTWQLTAPVSHGLGVTVLSSVTPVE